MAEAKALFRSRDERMVAGVGGGIAEYFEMDPTVVRLLTVLLTLPVAPATIVAYIVMWIIVPEQGQAVVTSGGYATMEDEQSTTGVPAEEAEQAPPVTPPAPQPTPAQQPPPPSYAYQPQPFEPPKTSHRSGAIWFGVILIAIGAAIIIDRLVPGVRIWQLWPLLIIALGIKTIFTSGGDGS